MIRRLAHHVALVVLALAIALGSLGYAAPVAAAAADRGGMGCADHDGKASPTCVAVCSHCLPAQLPAADADLPHRDAAYPASVTAIFAGDAGSPEPHPPKTSHLI